MSESKGVRVPAWVYEDEAMAEAWNRGYYGGVKAAECEALTAGHHELAARLAFVAARELASGRAVRAATTAEERLAEAARTIEGLRTPRRVDGFSHSTACNIWGDDGQGHWKGQPTTAPCSCGALENWYKSQAASAERERDYLAERVEALEAQQGALVTRPAEGGTTT